MCVGHSKQQKPSKPRKSITNTSTISKKKNIGGKAVNLLGQDTADVPKPSILPEAKVDGEAELKELMKRLMTCKTSTYKTSSLSRIFTPGRGVATMGAYAPTPVSD